MKFNGSHLGLMVEVSHIILKLNQTKIVADIVSETRF